MTKEKYKIKQNTAQKTKRHITDNKLCEN